MHHAAGRGILCRVRRATRWTAAALAVAGALAAFSPELNARQRVERVHGPDAVISVLAGIELGLRSSRYSHTTRVDPSSGLYEFDCSGLVAWVLRRASPRAHAAVAWRAKSGRPLARDYYAQIAATRAGAPARWGWSRVDRVEDARAGDVIAWLRPKQIRSTNTGHVAFLVAPPRRVPGEAAAYLLRIADASRYRHEDDSRAESGRDGYGTGTILVVADPETGAPIAYGWVGLRSAWVLAAKIAIGRPER
jgi:cell wall-associated NlpC family hydrolase